MQANGNNGVMSIRMETVVMKPVYFIHLLTLFCFACCCLARLFFLGFMKQPVPGALGIPSHLAVLFKSATLNILMLTLAFYWNLLVHGQELALCVLGSKKQPSLYIGSLQWLQQQCPNTLSTATQMYGCDGDVCRWGTQQYKAWVCIQQLSGSEKRRDPEGRCVPQKA